MKSVFPVSFVFCRFGNNWGWKSTTGELRGVFLSFETLTQTSLWSLKAIFWWRFSPSQFRRERVPLRYPNNFIIIWSLDFSYLIAGLP